MGGHSWAAVREIGVETFSWENWLFEQKPHVGFELGSPMFVAKGQQYNVGERPTFILYIT